MAKKYLSNGVRNYEKLFVNVTGGGTGGAVDSVNGQTGEVIISKADLGLNNVDNTSDLNKPISNATQSQLNLKANKTELISKADLSYVNTELNKKIDKNNTYDKTTIDTIISNKANINEVYTKNETYNKNEVDNKIASIPSGDNVNPADIEQIKQKNTQQDTEIENLKQNKQDKFSFTTDNTLNLEEVSGGSSQILRHSVKISQNANNLIKKELDGILVSSEIKDNVIDEKSTWSSKKIDDTIQGITNGSGAVINDAGITTSTVWSSKKTNDTITSVNQQLMNNIENVTDNLNTKADKTDVYTKNEANAELDKKANQNTTYTKDEVNDLVNSVPKMTISIVDNLPTTGEANKIYFIKKTGTEKDIHDEYMWIENKFELVGSTSVDLTDYAKKSDVTNLQASHNSDINSLRTAINDKISINKINESNGVVGLNTDKKIGIDYMSDIFDNNTTHTKTTWSSSKINSAITDKVNIATSPLSSSVESLNSQLVTTNSRLNTAENSLQNAWQNINNTYRKFETYNRDEVDGKFNEINKIYKKSELSTTIRHLEFASIDFDTNKKFNTLVSGELILEKSIDERSIKYQKFNINVFRINDNEEVKIKSSVNNYMIGDDTRSSGFYLRKYTSGTSIQIRLCFRYPDNNQNIGTTLNVKFNNIKVEPANVVQVVKDLNVGRPENYNGGEYISPKVISASIDDGVISNNTTWSSQYISDRIPDIDDNNSSDSALWSSEKTKIELVKKADKDKVYNVPIFVETNDQIKKFKLSGLKPFQVWNENESFLLRSRANECIIFSLGKNTQDKDLDVNYSAMRISRGHNKIRNIKVDKVAGYAYIELLPYSGLFISQINGTRVNLRADVIDTIPTDDNIIKVPIEDVASTNGLRISNKIIGASRNKYSKVAEFYLDTKYDEIATEFTNRASYTGNSMFATPQFTCINLLWSNEPENIKVHFWCDGSQLGRLFLVKTGASRFELYIKNPDEEYVQSQLQVLSQYVKRESTITWFNDSHVLDNLPSGQVFTPKVMLKNKFKLKTTISTNTLKIDTTDVYWNNKKGISVYWRVIKNNIPIIGMFLLGAYSGNYVVTPITPTSGYTYNVNNGVVTITSNTLNDITLIHASCELIL